MSKSQIKPGQTVTIIKEPPVRPQAIREALTLYQRALEHYSRGIATLIDNTFDDSPEMEELAFKVLQASNDMHRNTEQHMRVALARSQDLVRARATLEALKSPK